jgi:hypothetical protein
MYDDFSTDYHYDVENKPHYQPPKSLLSLYLDARDLHLLIRPTSYRKSLDISSPTAPFYPEISASQLMTALIEAAWISLNREAEVAELTLDGKEEFKNFFQSSQLVLLIDNLERVPYEYEGTFCSW